MGSGKILTCQTALVTGANAGIGEGIARAMASAGANVVINYVGDEDAAVRLVQEIEVSKGRAIAIKADVRRENEVFSMFVELRRSFGTLDILVNNAGVQRDAPFVDMTLQQWQTVLDINLTGSFLCAREAAKEFIRRGIIPERSCAAGKIAHDYGERADMENHAMQSKGSLSVAVTPFCLSRS